MQFLGPRDDVSRLMLAADLLVHPARNENAGMVLLEAMVSGNADSRERNLRIRVSHPAGGRKANSFPSRRRTISTSGWLRRPRRDRRWSRNALGYVARNDFHGMTEACVRKAIEVASRGGGRPDVSAGRDLCAAFGGQPAFERLFQLEGTVYRHLDGRRTLRFSAAGKHYFAKIHKVLN